MVTIVICLGLQVAPAELEDLLFKNPDVEDAAVIGIQGYYTFFCCVVIVITTLLVKGRNTLALILYLQGRV